MMEAYMDMWNAFSEHIANGFALWLTHWHGIHKEDFSIQEEGVLVSPVVQNVLISFPCGSFQCGHCKNMNHLDQHTNIYYEGAFRSLVCEACVQPPSELNRVILPLYCPTDVPVSSNSWFVYENQRPQTLDERTAKNAYYQTVCQTYADTLGLIYLGGKNVRDLYIERVTRRAYVRWREVRKKRAIARLFQVLVRNAMIGKDAAMVLAQNVKYH